jgi:pilus assembly protein CpaC
MSIFTKTIIAAAVALSVAPLNLAASAQNLLDLQITEAGDSDVTETITLGLNKSTIVNFNNPASDIYITNPAIADAAVQTDRRIVFRGIEIGQTNAFVFDAAGNQMLNLEIRVEPDVTALSDLISRHVPGARIKAEAVNSNVLLTGLVDSLSQSDAVIRLANAYLGANDDTEFGVINMMEIAAKDQVLLQVRIVEMQRTVIKQLGIDIGQENGIGRLQGERVVQQLPPAGTPPPGFEPFDVLEGAPPFAGNITAAATQAFSVAGLPIGGLALSGAFSNLLNGSDTQSQTTLNLQALERVGIVRTLAEPNLTALSGEPANFLVGGEFPVPVAQDNSGAISALLVSVLALHRSFFLRGVSHCACRRRFQS